MNTRSKKIYLDISCKDADYAKLDNLIFKDSLISIKKDSLPFQTFSLNELLLEIENLAKENVSFVSIPQTPHQDHIKSRAKLINFKILPDGNWAALVETEIWVERGFPFQLQFLYVEDYGDATLHSEETDTIINPDSGGVHIYCREETRTPELIRQPQIRYESAYVTTSAHCKGLVLFHSDLPFKLVAYHVSAYPLKCFQCSVEIKFDPEHTFSEIGSSSDFEHITYMPQPALVGGLQSETDADKVRDSALGTSGIYIMGSVAHLGSGLFIAYQKYYTFGKTVIPASGYSSERKIGEFHLWALTTIKRYNSRNLPDAPDYDHEVNDFVTEFSFPVQDGFYAVFKKNGTYVATTINSWSLTGIFDKDGKRVTRPRYVPYNHHKLNMSIAPLKNNQFLLGVRKDSDKEIAGTLYKIDSDGNFELLDTGLKNFRLRELKRINKSKK